jgi:hypothetical protein
VKMTLIVIALVFAGPQGFASDNPALPALKRQSSVRKVVEEHMNALNQCDWKRLMAQYPKDVELLLPGGTVVTGRGKVGDLFRNFCRPPPDGLKGLNFTVVSTRLIGNTLDVTWRADADFLTEPYQGSDAYVTREGLLAGQVTTFDAKQLKLKP